MYIHKFKVIKHTLFHITPGVSPRNTNIKQFNTNPRNVMQFTKFFSTKLLSLNGKLQ